MSKITAVQGVCTGRVACSGTTFCDYLKKQTPEILDCTVKNICIILRYFLIFFSKSQKLILIPKYIFFHVSVHQKNTNSRSSYWRGVKSQVFYSSSSSNLMLKKFVSASFCNIVLMFWSTIAEKFLTWYEVDSFTIKYPAQKGFQFLSITQAKELLMKAIQHF